MDAYRQKVKYAVEALTRLRKSSTSPHGELVTTVRTDMDTLTGLAGAGLMLAVIAGIEHGIRDEHEAMQWALDLVDRIVRDDEDDPPTLPVVDLQPEGPAADLMTIRRLIGLLNAVAKKLPMGVDSEVTVGVQGKGIQTQIGEQVAVTTMTSFSKEGLTRSWAAVWGMPEEDTREREQREQQQPEREWTAPDVVSHFLMHSVREARGAGGFADEWAAIQGFAAEIGAKQTDAIDAAREAGASWSEIAAVTGESEVDLRAKYER